MSGRPIKRTLRRAFCGHGACLGRQASGQRDRDCEQDRHGMDRRPGYAAYVVRLAKGWGGGHVKRPDATP